MQIQAKQRLMANEETLSPEDRKQAIAWYAKGFDLITIAQHFGVDTETLRKSLHNVGAAAVKAITVKVSTKSGNHWVTPFNGTLQEAEHYFGVGRRFVAHEDDRTGKETYDTITKIEEVAE